MMRSWIGKHYPHILLTASSAACLMIVLAAPDRGHTARYVWPDQTQGDLSSLDYITVKKNQTQVRSLADILQQARLTLEQIQRDRDQVQDEPGDSQRHRMTADEDASPHQTIQRRSMASLPKVTRPSAGPGPEYIDVSDPLAWRPPDALPAREYVILEFGEVDQEQPEESTSDINSLAQASRTPAEGDVFAAVNETASQEPGLAPLVVQTSFMDPVTALTATATETSAAPPVASVSRSASRPAVASPATRVEPLTLDRRPASASDRNRSDQPIKTDPKTTWAERPAPTVTPIETPTKDNALTAEAVKPTGYLSDRQNQTTLVSNTTPTSTPDQPQPDRHRAFPNTTRDLASAKPLDKPRAGFTSQNAGETVNQTTQPLVVLIDDYGTIGADRLNAINNAMSRINDAAKKANLGIELKTTTDKRDGYNILFREDDGKDMGNKLGLSQFAVTEDGFGNEIFLGEDNQASGGKAQITLNNAFDWFAGNNASEIGDNEYDYQTAIEHELLHMIGLDDGLDNLNAVSHSLLSPGEIRRDIDRQELEDLANLYASNNPWQPRFDPASGSHHSRGKVRYQSKALTAAVPEPASAALIAAGGVIGIVRRRR